MACGVVRVMRSSFGRALSSMVCLLVVVLHVVDAATGSVVTDPGGKPGPVRYRPGSVRLRRAKVTVMELRRMGDSGLWVSAVGIGCNNFGMRIDEAGTKAVVDAAFDAGITFFDTAESYGGAEPGVRGVPRQGPGRPA